MSRMGHHPRPTYSAVKRIRLSGMNSINSGESGRSHRPHRGAVSHLLQLFHDGGLTQPLSCAAGVHRLEDVLRMSNFPASFCLETVPPHPRAS